MAKSTVDTDELLDELHNLKIDLKDMTAAYEDERKDAERLQRDNEKLSEEVDRLSTQADEVEERLSRELSELHHQRDEGELKLRSRVQTLEDHYLKMLSVIKTIEDGNYEALIHSREGQEFVSWAAREFENETMRKFGGNRGRSSVSKR